jgi:hypothetical protein
MVSRIDRTDDFSTQRINRRYDAPRQDFLDEALDG